MPKHKQITTGSKLCSDCGVSKIATDFFTIDKRGKPTLFPYCKPCCTIRAKSKRESDPERTKSNDKKYHLRYGYNLTRVRFDSLFCEQLGKCAICEVVVDPAYVDHCHITGAVRGLLCKHCNFGLGHFKEDPLILDKAISYLLKKKKYV